MPMRGTRQAKLLISLLANYRKLLMNMCETIAVMMR